MKPIETRYFFYMIWATTQHYADFEAQIKVMNEGDMLGKAQFAEAKDTVIRLVLQSVGL